MPGNAGRDRLDGAPERLHRHLQWTAPDGTPFLRFAYAAEPVSHDPARPLDTGILRAVWLTPAELKAEPGRLRSPLVRQVVADYLAGQRHPLSIVKEAA